MGEFFQIGEDETQALHEHRAGHLPVGLASGGHLVHENQDAVDEHHRQLVFDLFGIPVIGNLGEPLQ